MEQDCNNIFKIARENANRTQDDAAELIGVSSSTISNWERGEFKELKGSDVIKAAKLYKAPDLIMKYLTCCSPYRHYLPNYEDKPLSEIAMDVLDAMESMTDIRRQMIRILKDNRVEDHEKPDLVQVLKVCSEMNDALTSLLYTNELLKIAQQETQPK